MDITPTVRPISSRQYRRPRAPNNSFNIRNRQTDPRMGQKTLKALIQLDNEEIALLAQVKSVSSFAKGYPPISNKLGQLQIALGKDLGIQPAEV